MTVMRSDASHIEIETDILGLGVDLVARVSDETGWIYVKVEQGVAGLGATARLVVPDAIALRDWLIEATS